MIKFIFLKLITLYQKFISPSKPPCCRFYPTCSSYSFEAIERFGAVKGGLLSIYRIIRCNPFCQGGIDRVPERWTDAFRKNRINTKSSHTNTFDAP